MRGGRCARDRCVLWDAKVQLGSRVERNRERSKQTGPALRSSSAIPTLSLSLTAGRWALVARAKRAPPGPGPDRRRLAQLPNPCRPASSALQAPSLFSARAPGHPDQAHCIYCSSTTFQSLLSVRRPSVRASVRGSRVLLPGSEAAAAGEGGGAASASGARGALRCARPRAGGAIGSRCGVSPCASQQSQTFWVTGNRDEVNRPRQGCFR